MSEGFKEWLKEVREQYGNSNCYDMITFEAFVCTLGEWHLQMTKKCIEVHEGLHSNVINSLGLAHKEIAVACLGEKE